MKRRAFVGAAAALLAPLRVVRAQGTNAHVSTIDPLIRSLTDGRPVWPGKVLLEMPKLAENGHSVALTVSVQSPMSADEHVRAVHLISEKNPVRDMASFYFDPRGRAEIGTRVRLNGSQRITAIAELSDGTFWSDQVMVQVTVPACTDGG